MEKLIVITLSKSRVQIKLLKLSFRSLANVVFTPIRLAMMQVIVQFLALNSFKSPKNGCARCHSLTNVTHMIVTTSKPK